MADQHGHHGHDHHGHEGHGHGDHAHGGHGHGDHAHGHHAHGGHGHVHAPADFGRAFAIGIALNTGFVAVEAAYGVLSGSMALLADAGHNLSDVLGLLVAWAAASLSRRLPTARYTYGLGGTSILAALANATLLLVAVGAIAWEAILRLADPQPIAGVTVMVVAGIGILVNGITAWMFASGRKGDLNIRGAYLHMVADAAISAGVVVAGLVIMLTGWLWLDAAVSLLIVAVITWGTWGLLRGSVELSLNAVPHGIDAPAVRGFLEGLPGVAEVHDLHIWPMSTTETALTAHLVLPGGAPGDRFLMEAQDVLRTRYRIGHATLQVETGELACPLAPAEVV